MGFLLRTILYATTRQAALSKLYYLLFELDHRQGKDALVVGVFNIFGLAPQLLGQ